MSSNRKDIIIFGAGGFAREVFQLINAINLKAPSWNCLGFMVDRQYISIVQEKIHGLPVLVAEDFKPNESTCTVVGVGSSQAREKIVKVLQAIGHDNFPSLVHPNAWVGGNNIIEEGVVICSGVSITTDTHIGRHTHINLGCTVGHDTVLGPYTTLSPGVNVSGNVKTEERVEIGTGASLIPKVSIGADSVIGAGAAVIGAIPPNSVAVGVPARIIKQNIL